MDDEVEVIASAKKFALDSNGRLVIVAAFAAVIIIGPLLWEHYSDWHVKRDFRYRTPQKRTRGRLKERSWDLLRRAAGSSAAKSK